jgi:hypothetical protein
MVFNFYQEHEKLREIIIFIIFGRHIGFHAIHIKFIFTGKSFI